MISYPIAVGGVGTRVLEAGQGDDVVVLVHGTGGRADRWIRNVDALAAAGYHTYALDLPGHGFAAKGPDVACSVPAYQNYLAGFLESIGAPRASIVGTSLGGHVVASYACAHPERVKAIALVGSMGLVPVGDEARARVQAGANNQTREGVAGKISRVILDPELVTPEMLEEEYRINNSPGAKESFATLGRYIGADLDRDAVGEKLARLDLPILLIWGDQDKVIPPATGQAARDLLPRSRLVMLANTSHTTYFERPADFNAILIDFLQGRTGAYQAPGVTWR